MKTRIIVILMLALSLNGIAENSYVISKDEQNMIIVNRGEWKSGDVKVVITDEDGFTVFTQKLAKNIDLIKYNMADLPNGQYSIEISDELRIIRKQFEMKDNQLVVAKEDEKIYKPQVKISKNIVDIQMLSLNKDVIVSLTDKEGIEILDEKLNTSIISKRLDINGLPSGNYILTIQTGGRYFNHEFTK